MPHPPPKRERSTTRIPGGLTTPEEVTIAPGETTTMDLFAIYP